MRHISLIAVRFEEEVAVSCNYKTGEIWSFQGDEYSSRGLLRCKPEGGSSMDLWNFGIIRHQFTALEPTPQRFTVTDVLFLGMKVAICGYFKNVI
jgi:hypothetical protein